MLHVAALLNSLSLLMRLLNHVLGAHDLAVFENLLEDVDVSIVLKIHYFSVCNLILYFNFQSSA